MLLAFDTSGPHCTTVLAAQDGSVIAMRSEEIGRGHAEHLMGFAQDVLAQGGARWSDLTCIGCTTGPGSFTGLRVGLATAQGLALALKKPGVGVSVFEVLARACLDTKDPHPFCIVQDARREQVYLQTFNASGQPMAAPCVVDLTQLAKEIPTSITRVAGTGAQMAAMRRGDLQVLDMDPYPTPQNLATACAAAPKEASLSPLYLRSADAKPQRAVAQL
ncbi:MAG: tRNA (adenosine(37)-N6)-threonylcarbamoyltransferase complex dimerization subunit type 1 TsaB [Pseudomonadota bacterium]